MRYIGNDMNALGIIQMIRPLELGLELRSRLEVEVWNNL